MEDISLNMHSPPSLTKLNWNMQILTYGKALGKNIHSFIDYNSKVSVFEHPYFHILFPVDLFLISIVFFVLLC